MCVTEKISLSGINSRQNTIEEMEVEREKKNEKINSASVTWENIK